MNTQATEMLQGASLDFLRRHSPFNRMESEALAFLADRVVLAFHPRDSVILSPEMGQVSQLHIVQRGKVLARQAGNVSVTEYSALTMGPGECFPIGAISAQRPSTNTYVAVEDSFCFQLGADDFMQLMEMSPVFHLFCTKYIASLLNQSREQLQSQFAQRAAEQQTMTTPLGHLVKREPISVGPEVSSRQALEHMAQERVGCMVVADADQRPLGIITQSDLLSRVVLPAFDLNRPVTELMSGPPHMLSTSASAYDAALEMATHGVRHLLVIDGDRRLKGVVSERDLFSLQRIGLRQIRAGIENATDIDALQQASRDIRQLALNLIAQGIGSEQLTQFISALNDALTRRIIELQIERHGLRDLQFCWLAFGSEGRHEQTLSTDQDNGIIYALPDGADGAAYKQSILTFARAVNEDLAACGFPLCKGNIMASNPDLCLTLDQWKRRFSSWISEPDPQALLNATIFFDFRSLYGDEGWAEQLRSHLFARARDNSAFLRMLAGNALTAQPPLGRIRDFVTDDDPKHPGTIDLKKFGARIFVDAARIHSLRTGVASSSTVQRMRQASRKLGIAADETSAVIEGFNFIQLLRLRSQHLDTEHDAPGDNRVNPDRLNELDRRILKEAFRQARKVQSRLKLDYQL